MVIKTAGNERTMNRTLKAILLSAGLCSLPNLAFSAIVYDNTATADPSGQQYFPTPTGLEFGDQVTLAGTERTLSQFSFYYFFNGASVTSQTLTLRMYANNGTNPPVSAFYTSDAIPLSIGDNGFNNQNISFTNAIPTILPDSFTWTVQFSNLGAGQTGGLLLYGPPNVGSSFNDFWQNDGAGNWTLNQINNGSALADFAARISAVPEPGVLALSGLGALLLAGLGRLRKPPE